MVSNRGFLMQLGPVRVQKNLEKAQYTDALTGAWSRRMLDVLSESLMNEYKLMGDSGRKAVSLAPITIVMGDLNGFKMINDQYGHDAGDRALIHFVRVVESNVRGQDILIRLGGDEFFLVLFDVEKDVADKIGARLTEALKNNPIYLEDARIRLHLQASLGAVSLRGQYLFEDKCSWENPLKAADRVMYRVKHEMSVPYHSVEYDPDGLAEESGQSGASDGMHRQQQTLFNSMVDMINGMDGYHKNYVGRCRYMTDNFLRWAEANHPEPFRKCYPDLFRIARDPMRRKIFLDLAAYHDVGKIFVPLNIHRKRQGLTDTERRRMQDHLQQGADIIKSLFRQSWSEEDISTGDLHQMVDGVMEHHECWDGSGYPKNLFTDGISEYGRLIALVGSTSSMLSSRPFAQEQPMSFVARELWSNRETLYDPCLTVLFLLYLAAENQGQFPSDIRGVAEDDLKKMKDREFER